MIDEIGGFYQRIFTIFFIRFVVSFEFCCCDACIFCKIVSGQVKYNGMKCKLVVGVSVQSIY